jgi:hypothetical protein
LRATDIELIIHRFGGEQWSEHFISGQTLFQLRLSSVRAPVCRLLAAAASTTSLSYHSTPIPA